MLRGAAARRTGHQDLLPLCHRTRLLAPLHLGQMGRARVVKLGGMGAKFTGQKVDLISGQPKNAAKGIFAFNPYIILDTTHPSSNMQQSSSEEAYELPVRIS